MVTEVTVVIQSNPDKIEQSYFAEFDCTTSTEKKWKVSLSIRKEGSGRKKKNKFQPRPASASKVVVDFPELKTGRGKKGLLLVLLAGFI